MSHNLIPIHHNGATTHRFLTSPEQSNRQLKATPCITPHLPLEGLPARTRGAHIHSRLPLVINSLKSVIVSLSSLEALLTEVEVAAHLAVVARAVNGRHLTPTTTVEGRKSGRMGEIER